MAHVSFNFPNELFLGLDVTSEDVTSFVRRMTAMALFEHEEVSCGWCAHIADMPIADFIRFLGEHEVSIFRYDSDEELLEDIASVWYERFTLNLSKTYLIIKLDIFFSSSFFVSDWCQFLTIFGKVLA